MDPPVFQVAIKWWLGLDVSEGSPCALCPGSIHLTNLATAGRVLLWSLLKLLPTSTYVNPTTCLHQDVPNHIMPSYHVFTILASNCMDILLPNWFLGRTAALDVSITSPLNPVISLEAGAAQAIESRKHHTNGPSAQI